MITGVALEGTHTKGDVWDGRPAPMIRMLIEFRFLLTHTHDQKPANPFAPCVWMMTGYHIDPVGDKPRLLSMYLAAQ